MTSPKIIWEKENLDVSRWGTLYNVTVSDEFHTATVEVTREEFRQMFLAMKKELGLAGD